MEVPFCCAVSEPPCSSQDGWGGGGTVHYGVEKGEVAQVFFLLLK